MRIRNLLLVSCLVGATALLGCGGAGVDTGGTRGEGNIPIGRVQLPPGGVGLCVTNRYGVAINGTVDAAGVMWAPTTAVGTATITLQPADSTYDSVTFQMQMGVEQQYVIDAAINGKKPSAVVTGVAVEFINGRTPEVGKSYPVKTTVSGTDVTGLKPTVWVEGDIGYMDSSHRFVATAAGTGYIKASLGGVTGSMTVTVTN